MPRCIKPCAITMFILCLFVSNIFLLNEIKSEDAWENIRNNHVVGYAIITTERILHQSKKLIEYAHFLRKYGYKVYIVTEKDYGYAEGQERALNIRNWLKKHYKELSILYVLLIGNPDPDDPRDPNDNYGDLPMIMTFPFKQNTNIGIPTDFFYADLTGSCDLDGDGLCGEYPDDIKEGGPDFKAEVYVGRIPVYDNVSALDEILMRMMTKIEPPRRILLVLDVLNYKHEDYKMWERTDGKNFASQLWTKKVHNLFDITGMYERGGLVPISNSTPFYKVELNLENFIEEWNKGYGLVFWSAHGDKYSAYRKLWVRDDGDGVAESDEIDIKPFINVSIVERYLRPEPTVVFQASCNNGYPEDPNNLQYVLLRKAAMVTIAPTREVWYPAGEWSPGDFPSQFEIGYRFILEISKSRRIGIAFYNVLSSFDIIGSQRLANIYAFNIYGDPSFSLYGWPVKVIHVPHDFTTISEALSYVSPLTTILVDNGTYSDVIILKGMMYSNVKILSKYGHDNCSIVFSGISSFNFLYTPCLIVVEDTWNVEICGFKIFGNEGLMGFMIKNSKNVTLDENVFVMPSNDIGRVENSSQVILEKNTFQKFSISVGNIKILSSNTTMISNNTFENIVLLFVESHGNTIKDNLFKYGGVILRWSYNNTFFNNTIGELPLIYVERAKNVIVEGPCSEIIVLEAETVTIRNVSLRNLYLGIYVISSSRILLENVTIVDSYYGIVLEGVTLVKARNITLQNNMYGFQVSQGNDIGILWSRVIEDRRGIIIISCDNVTLVYNIFSKNSIAISVLKSSNVSIFLNDLVKNLLDIFSIRSSVYLWSPREITYIHEGKRMKSFLGNYWGNITERDKNNDGILDDPYDINGELVDKYPLAMSFKYYLGITPRAVFTYSPTNPHIFEKIVFNASESYGINSHIVKYEWDFGDGCKGYGPIVKHRYWIPGKYKVTLTVYDNNGIFSTYTVEIKVTVPVVPIAFLVTIGALIIYMLIAKKRKNS
ncbi:MAG: right-handed parallel beta-helix repeat-containing protein [Euryarchaeota archaeon]|nr:right-handed parallel beta-helix repeat-containing protein [Euryarchaeota archaeon]